MSIADLQRLFSELKDAVAAGGGGVQVYQTTDAFLHGCGLMGIALTNAPNARIDWAGHRPNYHPRGQFA